MLNIKYIKYPKLYIESNTEFDEDKEPDFTNIRIETTLDKSSGENDSEYMLILNVFTKNDEPVNAPYLFDIVAFGVFALGEQAKVVQKAIAGRNGSGVLYAGIREVLATMTGRCPFGSITLPTHYFSNEDFLTKKEANEFNKTIKFPK